jgi:hypothetical protein
VTSTWAGPAPSSIGLEGGTQVRQVGLERVGRRRGRFCTPENFEQAIGRQHLIGADDEGREHQACLGARELDGPAVDDDLERSEHPYLHTQSWHVPVPSSAAPVVFKAAVEDHENGDDREAG